MAGVDVGTVKGTISLDDQFSKKIGVIGDKMAIAGKKWEAAGRNLEGIGNDLLPVSAAVGLLGAATIKAASDFESSFAGVRKTVDATAAEFDMLSEGFRAMAKEIPVNVNALNAVGEAAGQLGIKTENILGFTRVMADLGVATNLSAEQAATSLARLANVTGLPQTEFDRLGSTIVALGNTFATTESEIVNFGLRMAGAGTIAGLTEAEILGIGAAMSSVGVEAEAGGTAVQKVLLGITQAVSQGSEDLAVFAETAGLSADEFSTAWETDAAGAFEMFVSGLGDQGDAAFVTLEKLDLQDQRLIRSFLSLAGAGDLLADAMAGGNQAFADNTALAKEAGQRYETFASQVTLLLNEIGDVAIEFGTALLPVMKDFLGLVKPLVVGLGEAATLFAELPQPIRAVGLAFMGVLVAAGPMLLIAGKMAIAWGALTGTTGAFAAKQVVVKTAIAASSSKLGLFVNLLPTALTRTKQNKDAMGKWTKGFKVFDGSVLKTKVTWTGFTGVLGKGATAVKTAAIAFGTKFVSAVKLAGTAIKGLWTLMLANPFVLIAAAIGIAAIALSSFVFREGGGFENWMAGTTESIQDLRGEFDKLGTSMKDREKSVQALSLVAKELNEGIANGVAGSQEARDALDELVRSGEPAEMVLGKVAARSNRAGDAGRAFAGALKETSDAMNAEGRAAAALAAEQDKLAASVAASAAEKEKFKEALDAIGLGSEAALTTLGNLDTLIESGKVPADLLAEAVLGITAEYENIVAVSPEVAAMLQTVTDKMDPQALAAAKMEAAMGRLGLITLDSFQQEVDDLALSFENGRVPPGQFADAIDDVDKRLKDAGFDPDELGLGKLTLEFQKTRLGAEGIKKAMPPATNALLLFGGAAGKLPDALATDKFEVFADVIKSLGVRTLPQVTSELRMTERAIRAGVIPTSDLDRIVQELDAKYKELAGDAPEVVAALDGITDAAREQGAELEKDKSGLDKFKDKLKGGVAGLTDPNNIAGLIGTASDAFLKGDFLQGTEQIVSEIGATIGAAFGPIGKMVGQLAGKLVPLIAGIFSKPEFKKVAKDIGRDLGVDISEELSKKIAETSKETGNRFAAVTKFLPDIIKEAGVESDKALSTFVGRARDNLSLLADGVVTSKVAFGQLGESLGELIPKMGEVGASSQTAAQVFEVFDTALGQVRTGLASTDDAAKLLEGTFPELAKQVEEFGAAGIAGLRGIILQTRELGIEVESVTQFVIKQSKQIVGGVDRMLKSLSTRIGQLPEDLDFGAAFATAKAAFGKAGMDAGAALVDGVAGTIQDPKLQAAVVSIGTQAQFAAGAIATAFSEMLAQGVPVTEIVTSISGQIGELGGIFTELGIEAPASFAKIASFASKVGREDIAPIIEGIQGIGQAVDGLRGIGLLAQGDFDAFAISLASGFQELSAGGLTAEEAFAAIGPQIQDLVDLQEEFGFTVDAGTQALIDQAVQQGVVKTASLDTTDSIQAGFQGLFDRFDAFLGKQGVATDGMFNFGVQASNAMAVVDSAVNTSAGNIATQFTQASDTASTGFENLKDTQQRTFLEMQQAAAVTTDEMVLDVDAGLALIEDRMGGIAAAGSSAFGEIAEAAGQAVRDSLDRFGEMEHELVGASIIPDMVSAANAEILTIGDASGVAATASLDAFATAGTEGFLSGDATSSTDVGLQGGQPIDIIQRAGGDDQTVQLIVDGQALATVVLKHTPRAKANHGLGR